MASVTSLDADMRNLRLSRYTPQAANEARSWIESTLSIQLPPGDLLDALTDGVILCQLANLAIQPHHAPIKWKKSTMPFIQMENISHFLKACEMPPLSLPAHDRFLTVDLYEGKDAAQVLQCLGAFSRQANRVNPQKFTTTIGPKKAGATAASTLTPSLSGTSSSAGGAPPQSNPSAPTSSWSKRSDEGATAPAWNIHQYGYMGGASQGNQGINFGARRQITTQAPQVPSLAEKERLRKEKEAEAMRQQQQETEEQERRRRAAADEEERARVEEERKWEEETERLRSEERRRLEQQKREWEDQERKWKEEEETRRKEEAQVQRNPSSGAAVLRGQSLADYQKQAGLLRKTDTQETPEQKRVRELEQQLEEARARERQYQAEREERLRKDAGDRSRPNTAQTETSRPQSENSWAGDEREVLRLQWQGSRDSTSAKPALPPSTSRHLPSTPEPSNLQSRPLPEPTKAVTNSSSASPFPSRPPQSSTAVANPSSQPKPFTSSRPLPAPQMAEEASFEPEPALPNRTDQFLATNTAPHHPGPRISSSHEAGDTALEQSRDRDARMASQQKTKAGAWASKSLLEREMERERERQREWEANQQTTKSAPRDANQGTGQGQSWDVNQYGYMGGDNMNRGSGVGSGINIGGRRQIIGPRPKP